MMKAWTRRLTTIWIAAIALAIALAFSSASLAFAASELTGGSVDTSASVAEQAKKSPKEFAVKAKLMAEYPTATTTGAATNANSAPAKKKAKTASNTVRSRMLYGTRYLFLPSHANLKQLRLYNAATTSAIYVAAKQNGKYKKVSAKKPIDITKFKRDSSGARTIYVKGAKNYPAFKVKVMKSANIRSMYITSADPKNKGRSYIERSGSHHAKAKGAMTLVTADGSVAYNGKLEEIKGRGNSTWRAPKKPYQIKLGKKTSLLDGTEDNVAKTWVLLANAFDDTYSRNYLAYKTALAVGMKEAPECEFVDLYYDGEYRGNYLLSEKVQINGGRVDIYEQENKSTDKKDLEDHGTAAARNKYGKEFQFVKGVKTKKNITGGYLVELDNPQYGDERCWFKTSIGTFVLKSPEDASKAQVKYISEYVQAAVNELRNNKKPTKMDLTSLAKAHLVNEFAKNPDYLRFSSTYFYKGKGKDVLHAGPVWDFDLAFGVHCYQAGRSYRETSNYAARGYSDFFMNNKYFKPVFKRVYKKSFLPQAKGVIGKGKKSKIPSVASVKKMIAKSVAMDSKIHNTYYEWFVSKRFSSWSQSMSYTQGWATKRLTWMTKEIL